MTDVRARPLQKWGDSREQAGCSHNIQGLPVVAAVRARANNVTCQDIGPDWGQEFPNLEPGSGSWPLQPPQQPQVHKVDKKGRQLAQCGCLLRTLPPPPPEHPPFALTPENTHLVQEWLLDTYASSAFNTCPHQPLPLMTGLPPLRLIIKDNVEPVAVHRPSSIPAHWVEQVRLELERDIQLGVIERVPANTPTTWCSCMHVVGKKSGEPRRVVDLRAVNAATARQTHYTEAPFQQAMSVPPDTWRYTSDAWNGYHSIPLDTRDRHTTTFITPWGRMRYRVAPQGSISSGDRYTYWYDTLIRVLKRIKKCVDDVLGWAKTLLQLFYDVTQFLSHTSAHGVIQNPKKFTWGRKEVEFVGFWVKQDGIKPTEETLMAIKEFPRPTDITGIRSFYGLVEQVAYAFAKSTLMDPFRHLLKKSSLFAWNQSLQQSFDTAKKEIVELIRNGVKSFTLGSWTCLVTDWSQTGIGYVLWQKRCKCPAIHPSCCAQGWAMIMCGSRFCTGAESRYHPIEGELLAVAWALQKTSYYTLGSDNLLVLVDHKPLLGLLSTRELGDIENPRLQHLAEKLLRWTFRIEHIAGAKNHAPGALSRSPVQSSATANVSGLNFVDQENSDWSDEIEGQVKAAAATRQIMFTSWETVRQAGISDQQYTDLLHALESPQNQQLWDTTLVDYKKHKHNMSTVDGVALFKGRVVIPSALRHQVLEALHRSHQGITSMSLRTGDSVWWPGLTLDVAAVRANCKFCIQNAPTQPSLPPVKPPTPDFPFQMISADYFDYAGKAYLVIVDRYTNWPVVKHCKTSSSKELVTSLREFFCNYGAPEQITTDGGSSFLSAATQQFLANWNVDHRVSTAYNPHANLRAETAVKTVKRIITDNVGTDGSLDNDSFASSLLNYRNTPDRDTGHSPSQVLFARQLRDALPTHPRNLQIRKEWVLTRDLREKALAKRHTTRHQALLQHTHPLPPLQVGSTVQVQNQRGPHANKWDLSGVITEILPFDAYMIRMDGSGRATKRNRRFLKQILPYNSAIQHKNAPLSSPFANDISNTGPTADQAGRPSSTAATQETAADKSTTRRLPETDNWDAWSQEVSMSDEDFDAGLKQAHYNIVHDEITDKQPEAGPKPPIQLSEQDSAVKRPKRVKFSPQRLIEQ